MDHARSRGRLGQAALTCGLIAALAAPSQVAAFPGAAVSSGAAALSAGHSQVVHVNADAKEGRKRIIDGVKAFEKQQYDKAIERFSAALRSGGLASQDMAKAMYFRGQAYEKSGKAAEAIADLTSAIWLKDGLSETERKTAETMRAKAYQSVGIQASAPVTSSAATPAPVVVQAPAQALSKPATVARAAPAPSAPPPAFTTRVAKAPAPAPRTVAKAAPAVSKPVPAFTTRTTQAPVRAAPKPVIQPFSTKVANAPRIPAAVAQAPAPGAFSTQVKAAPAAPTQTAAVTQPSAGSSGSGSGFFGSISNFFSGGLSGGSSTSTAAHSPAAPASTGATSATSSWSTSDKRTSDGAPLTAARNPVGQASPLPPAAPSAATPSYPAVAASATVAPAQTAAAKPIVTAALTPEQPVTAVEDGTAGKPVAEDTLGRQVLVQVAAVRSRAEAERVVQRLVRSHSSDLGSRRPRIAEAVYGSMGTFYRVQVGPFDGDASTQGMCNALRSSGYDCLITTR